MLKHITDQNSESEINSKGVVILDVYADWCGPCKLLAPVIDKLGEDNNFKVLKINSDENREIVEKYNVTSLPTILFFIDGELKDKHIGYAPLEFIKEKAQNL